MTPYEEIEKREGEEKGEDRKFFFRKVF